MPTYPRVRAQADIVDGTAAIAAEAAARTAAIAAQAAIDSATYASVVAASGTGIDPTGAVDSATAIQALSDAAAALGIRTIWFQGIFLVGTALFPSSGQTWDGPGTLKAKSTNTTAVIRIDGKTDVRINVAIDGGMTSVLPGNPGGVLANDRYGINITGGSERCRITSQIRNVPGPAVRIYDSHRNVVNPDIYNAYYGVVIGAGGTVNDPSGGSHGNVVEHGVIRVVAKNGIFCAGDTSGSDACTQHNNRFSDLTIGKVGDTGIEVGIGTSGAVVSGVMIDGTEDDAAWVGAYNGILLRDAQNVSVVGFTIKNFPSYTNGNGSLLTLGNGIYVWPLAIGDYRGLAIGPGTISNCTRGVFLQGNQHTSQNSSLTGNYGSAGAVYGGNTLTGVSVEGTQLGILEGSWASVQNAIAAHGFYIQSVTGWAISGCSATRCQNNGFMIGDTNTASAYTQDVQLTGCRATSNGQQAITGQTYSGFYINGTSNQARTRLTGCRASDAAVSGSKTQNNGFRWNSTGEAPRLVDCSAQGHSGTYISGGAGTSWNGTGTDLYGATGGTIVSTAVSYSVAADVSTVIFTGTTGQTITIPSASFSGLNRVVRVRNEGSAAVTVAKSGGGTLYTTSIATGAEWVFVTDATNWY